MWLAFILIFFSCGNLIAKTENCNKSVCNFRNNEETYDVLVSGQVLLYNLKPFWKSTGLCPPDPHQASHKFLLSDDMRQNLFHIGSLPHNGLSQVRIHWMLDLVKIRVISVVEVFYDFNYIDKLIHILHQSFLLPGFELMGNPSKFFNDFENKTQLFIWRNMIEALAKHYIEIYGLEYVKKWNFETWNEPDHHDFDNLNFTLQGFLNYYDACSEGLLKANKGLRFGGPGGSCRIPPVGKSPICWALLDHCATGKNYFTGHQSVRLDFISLHKKGNGSSIQIIKEEIETIQYIRSQFPILKDVPVYNDEADPLKNWSLPQLWRADVTYAAMVVKIIISHLYYFMNSGSELIKVLHFGLISSDNAFLSYFPNQFTERTLLARFQINNTNPKFTEFVKKPVYTAFGLMSKVCPNILSVKIFHKGNHLNASDNRFGVMASQCSGIKNTVVVLYNSDDTISDDTIINVNMTINFSRPFGRRTKWAVLVLNNKKSNPFYEWTKLGLPAYPTFAEFSRIKNYEEPHMSGPWDSRNPQNMKIHLKVPRPGVALINLCKKFKKPKVVTHIQFFKIWRKSLQISWQDEHNKCILTYKVLYSSFLMGPYVQLNTNKIIFPSYWHACSENEYKCHFKGFYKVYAVDYWKQKGPYSESFYFNG